MTEPTRVGEGLARARQALEQARPPIPYANGDTSESVAEEAEGLRHHANEARWGLVCPRRFRDVSMEWVLEEHGKDAFDRLTAWAQTESTPNLVLFGPVGTGKTGTSLAVCKEGQIDRNIGVLFLPVTELLDQLRPGGPEGALERLCAAPRLIVDDLGSERPTDWTAERLGVLVNRRWLEERPTIATTNLTAEELEQTVGARTFSRLVGGALVLQLAGADRRRRK